MPIRQMKESSEQHLVIKNHLHNTPNQVQRAPKIAQNGKSSPPAHEPHSTKQPHNQASPPSKNRGRRRGRGGRKSDQGDVCMMRPSSRPCTVAQKPVNQVQNGHGDNGESASHSRLCLGLSVGLSSTCLFQRNPFLAI